MMEVVALVTALRQFCFSNAPRTFEDETSGSGIPDRLAKSADRRRKRAADARRFPLVAGLSRKLGLYFCPQAHKSPVTSRTRGELINKGGKDRAETPVLY